MKKKLKLDDREVEYTLKKSRRARHLRITLRCEAMVVTAPFWVANYKIEEFLQTKAGWILEKIKCFGKNNNLIKLNNGRTDYHKNKNRARGLIWKKIKKINDFYNFTVHRISIKCHRARWGSCSGRGNLNFNYQIVYLPDNLVEYIVTHELCHLKELNHSRKFWKLVGEYLPNFKICKKELRKYACG